MKFDGTKGADTLVGLLKEMNDIWGHGGDDNAAGGMLADTISGGKGDDNIFAGGGDDVISGNTGNDTLRGTEGDDTVRGGEGNDFVSGGKGHDILAGGKGDDVVHGNTGDDTVLGGSGNDVVTGDAGSDWLDGGAGNDVVSGGSGDDTVVVSTGTDIYSGGSGYDTLDFTRTMGSVNVDLTKGVATFGSGKHITTDKVSGFEVVAGNDGNGHYLGADKSATWFIGGAGNDWLRGKGGSDQLTGGNGADTFAYLKKDTAGGAVDKITDFQVGTDHLDMRDFLKGHASYSESVRFADAGNDTKVQGLVNHQWVDVAVLQGIDSHTVGFDILT